VVAMETDTRCPKLIKQSHGMKPNCTK
jgi:hypothetical protein